MDRQVIASLDPFIDALAPGRAHILSGATGTGKTAVSLRFIDAGLRLGEPAVLITSQRPPDLRALAEHVGIELGMPLAEDRLVVLRYAGDVAARAGRAGALYGAIDELRLMVDRVAPARLVIDSIMPFLAEDGAGGGAIGRLVSWLEAQSATTIITLPGSLDDQYDRRLEPLVQEAAGIFHLSRGASGAIALEAVTVRTKSFAPLPRRIALTPGAEPIAPAIAAIPTPPPTLPAAPVADAPVPPAPTESRRSPNGRRQDGRLRVGLLHTSASPGAELVALLRRLYDVVEVPIHRDVPAGTVDAALVETTYQTMDASLGAISRLARGESEIPIIAISPFDLRSLDRAFVLHAGADEFLTRAMGPGELLQRLDLAVRRGRAGGMTAVQDDEPLLRQPAIGGSPRVLSLAELDDALGRYHATIPGVQRTVVRLTPRNGDPSDLSAVAMRTARIGSGDLIALTADSVAVYLHGTRRRDAIFFSDRVRAQWAKEGLGTIHVEARTDERLAGGFSPASIDSGSVTPSEA